MAKTVENRVNPMRITDPDTGDVYVLEFSREAVQFAERRGFKIMGVQDNPETGIADLFFYAFRKNHRHVARGKTARMLEELGGLLPAEVSRLQELYSAAITSLNVEGERKNARLRVEL